MAVAVQKFFGAALRDVQYGETPAEAKHGIATPRHDVELVRSR